VEKAGNRKPKGELEARRFHSGENSMRMTIITAAVLFLFSSAAMAQSTDTKGPSTTGPAAQSGDNMAKGDMSKKKMTNTKSQKL
jgi:hypothetical protein